MIIFLKAAWIVIQNAKHAKMSEPAHNAKMIVYLILRLVNVIQTLKK